MNRIIKVESLMKQVLADIISKELHHIDIGFISILKVKITKDLSQAKVYYSQFGTQDEKLETQNTLQKYAKIIKGKLGDQIRLKKVPNLTFIFDTSLEETFKIIQKVDSLSEESNISSQSDTVPSQ